MQLIMICTRVAGFADLEMMNTTQKRGTEISSLQKLKTMSQIKPDALH